jgi:hypothetical protein
MNEGASAEEGQTWDPKSGVPPPITLEFGIPPAIPQVVDWDPNGTIPPPLPSWAKRPPSPDVMPPLPPISSPESGTTPPVPAGYGYAEPAWPGKELGLTPPLTPEFGVTLPPQISGESAVPDPQKIAYEGVSQLKERDIENPELLSEKEASKKFLSDERRKIAEEIRAERRRSRDNLAELSARTEIECVFPVEAEKDFEQMAAHYDTLSDERAAEANDIARRLSDSEMSEEDITEERENIRMLVDNDDRLRVLREKLAEHYAKAEGLAKEKFEELQKNVEQTIVRNNSFIVHTLTTHQELRHNELSNVTGRAKLEDDIDLLLSLEPSISTSSITPGLKTKLFQEEFGKIGMIIGGGDIVGATQSDAGSKSMGIKDRRIIGQDGVSTDEIDKTITEREAGDTYNEIVVNNPKVFGIFKSVDIDESGKMMGSPREFERYVNIATKKGVPPYIMTPDRRIYEFVSIDDDGIVTIGNEITPEQVATGNAGLPNEKRKKIGNEILRKHLFKDIHDHHEAKSIVSSLSEDGPDETHLSRDEYLDQLKNNPGEIVFQLSSFPESLRGDKQFMLESAKIDAVYTYEKATEDLKKDPDFVRKVYALQKNQQQTESLIYRLPDNLQKDPEIALIAIENDELDGLDISLADVPQVWESIMNKKVEDADPNQSFVRGIGEEQILTPLLSMRSENSMISISERLLTDPNFVDKLNKRYPNFKFIVDKYKQLRVTKLE